MKEQELQLVKQQAEREKEELLKGHKKQLEFVKKVSYSVMTVQRTSSSCLTRNNRKGKSNIEH